jgi:hypothetical protein
VSTERRSDLVAASRVRVDVWPRAPGCSEHLALSAFPRGKNVPVITSLTRSFPVLRTLLYSACSIWGGREVIRL